jgi:hypothetical protein
LESAHNSTPALDCPDAPTGAPRSDPRFAIRPGISFRISETQIQQF